MEEQKILVSQKKSTEKKNNIATARAVAGLPILMEFCVPFIKVGGYFVCLKGPNANLELEESKAAMEALGLNL